MSVWGKTEWLHTTTAAGSAVGVLVASRFTKSTAIATLAGVVGTVLAMLVVEIVDFILWFFEHRKVADAQ